MYGVLEYSGVNLFIASSTLHGYGNRMTAQWIHSGMASQPTSPGHEITYRYLQSTPYSVQTNITFRLTNRGRHGEDRFWSSYGETTP